jgi:hypothetical protein
MGTGGSSLGSVSVVLSVALFARRDVDLPGGQGVVQAGVGDVLLAGFGLGQSAWRACSCGQSIASAIDSRGELDSVTAGSV